MRQEDADEGPVTRFALDSCGATGLAHDPVDAGQADPRAVRLGREERLEGPLHHRGGHPHASVRDVEIEVAAGLDAEDRIVLQLLDPGRDPDAAPGWRGIAGVAHEVEKDLLEVRPADPGAVGARAHDLDGEGVPGDP